jgi:hypothetical protein
MNYIIVPSGCIQNVDFRGIAQTGPGSLRYSIDRKYFLLKYENEQPRFVFNICGSAIGLIEYSHEEILKILEGPEWKTQD